MKTKLNLFFFNSAFFRFIESEYSCDKKYQVIYHIYLILKTVLYLVSIFEKFQFIFGMFIKFLHYLKQNKDKRKLC